MIKVCLHCGYTQVAHKGQVYASMLLSSLAFREMIEWTEAGLKRHLADTPCDNYKQDNLLYLESISHE